MVILVGVAVWSLAAFSASPPTMITMSENIRRARISGLVSEHAARVGEPVTTEHVCMVCVATLGVDGCALPLISARGRWTLACTIGDLAGALADLQFTLDQGPSIDALATGNQVLVDDVTSTQATSQWPLFTAAAANAGIRSVFTFPLTAEGIHAGVLQPYRTTPSRLSDEDCLDAVVFADLALATVIDSYAAGDENDIAEMEMGERAVVYQATGMLVATLHLTLDEAMVRLKFYAQTQDCPITEVARAIVNGELHLDTDLLGIAHV